MKKLRTTLFVCLTALAVLTAFGCKGAQDLGKDAGKWGVKVLTRREYLKH